MINLGNFFDWKEQNHVFEDMAAFFDLSVKLTSDGEPEEIPSQIATPNLFSVLGINPIMGRTHQRHCRSSSLTKRWPGFMVVTICSVGRLPGNNAGGRSSEWQATLEKSRLTRRQFRRFTFPRHKCLTV